MARSMNKSFGAIKHTGEILWIITDVFAYDS
jgi:hypothetical protein